VNWWVFVKCDPILGAPFALITASIRCGIEELSTLTKWCQENHLSPNTDKTKELVVDFRRQSREHAPITIDKTPVERVNSFKFLGFQEFHSPRHMW